MLLSEVFSVSESVCEHCLCIYCIFMCFCGKGIYSITSITSMSLNEVMVKQVIVILKQVAVFDGACVCVCGCVCVSVSVFVYVCICL